MEQVRSSSDHEQQGRRTLVDVLKWRGQEEADRVAYVFLPDGESKEPLALTYGELHRRAEVVGACLGSSLPPGDRVLLLFPPGLEYIVAFMGCLYAGLIAVPAYPPRNKRTLPRLTGIAADARPALALTTADVLLRARSLARSAPELGSLTWQALEEVEAPAAAAPLPGVAAEAVAFLQYTSGSTGDPKGVILSHRNLMHNSEVIARAFQCTPDTVGVVWLPPYHDMGLIGGILQPLYSGFPCVLMAPAAFLRRPERWLLAISRHRGHISGGPDFAFDLCRRNVSPEVLQELDLSTWRLAFNGAEPVRPATLERFSATFEPCGFRGGIHSPCYGLAEATLMVSGGAESDMVVRDLSASELEAHRVAPPREGDEVKRLVGCGRRKDEVPVVIVDPEICEPCTPGRVGEIWVAGESVAQGFWNRSEETVRTFRARLAGSGEGPFMRTGDLGFLDGGELFVTGRLKDLIILAGRNLYPQDLEHTMEESHPALRRHCGAAVAVEEGGAERLVLLQELEFRAQPDPDEVISAIREAVAAEHEVPVHRVVLLKAGTIPRTSSGKIRRRASRQRLLGGQLDVVAEWCRNAGEGAAAAVEPGRKAPTEPGEAAPVAAEAAPQGVASQEAVSQESASREPAPPPAEIQRWLVEKLAARLGVGAAEVDARRPFTYFGLGSADVVSLVGELEAWLGRSLSPDLAWDHPNIEALASHLGGAAREGAAAVAPPVPEPIPGPGPKTAPGPGAAPEPPAAEAVAITGLACRLPGADSPEALWRLLADGAEGVGREPVARRLDLTGGGSAEAAGEAGAWGGFLTGIEDFDCDLFDLTEDEARVIDPQQRLLLEVIWEAVERAGTTPEALARGRTGVFVGMANTDYQSLVARSAQHLDPAVLPGNVASLAANRISYTFDWKGPSLVVDTACSSSLVALHLARRALLAGEADAAVVAAANLVLSPETTRLFERAGMLSADGRTRPFADGAAGYARSEGVVALLLKPLSAARAHGDSIWGVLRGSAVNHDGRAKVGLTAPSPSAQRRLLSEAYREAGVSPATVGLLEAHGTGTSFGDAVEARALAEVFAEATERRGFCALGSVRGNLGHCEAAAGMASVAKALLAFRHEALPPTLHVDAPNRHVAFEESPFYLNDQLRLWRRNGAPRRAGLSSFGFGGANAHVVLEEAPAPPTRREMVDRPVHVLTLSARSPGALSRLLADYRDFLNRDEATALADLCFTANTGRRRFGHRLAVVVRDREELAERLWLLRDLDALGRLRGASVFYAEEGAAGEDGEIWRRTAASLRRLPAAAQAAVEAWCSGPALERRIRPGWGGAEDPLTGPGPELDGEGWQALMRALAQLWVLGVEVDWEAADSRFARRRVELPPTPLERRRCWLDAAEEAPATAATATHPAEAIERRPCPPAPEEAAGTLARGAAAGAGEETSPGARGRIEGWLRQMVASVVNRRPEAVGLGTNFLELGLDSVPTLRLVRAVEAQLGTGISPLEVFEHPNIRRLAAFLEPRLGPAVESLPVAVAVEEPAPAPPPVVVEESPEPFPCTELQVAYLMARNIPANLGGRGCRIYVETDIPQPLDGAALEEAFDRLLRRHSMLRTVFMDDGRQRVLVEAPRYRIPVHDLRSLAQGEREERCLSLREELARTNLEPGEWPLFAIHAAHLTDGSFRLFLSLDMLQVDFLSLLILLEEWRRLYDDPAAQLPPLPTAFRDYVAGLPELRRSETFRRDEAYWRQRVPDFPEPPRLPVQRPEEARVQPDFASRSHVLSEARWQALKDRARAHQVTPAAVLMTAYCRVLAEWCGQQRFALNLPLFNRYGIGDVERIDTLVGPFTTNVLLPVELTPGASLWEDARSLHRACLEALEHRLFTGVELSRALAEHRRSGLEPPAPVVFTPAFYDGKEDLWGEIRVALSQTAMVWLDCIAVPDGGALRLFWDYVEDLFDPDDLSARFSRFLSLLEELAAPAQQERAGATGDGRWEGWPFIPAADWRQVLDLNRTAAPYPRATLHELVSAQARRSPEAPAVITGGEVLSYRRLEERSNQVAHALEARGIGSGQRVAVVMRRGCDPVVAILGILKSGAAYVPVDPTYPAERRRSILSQCRPALVITDEARGCSLPLPCEAPLLGLRGPEVQTASTAAPPPRGAPEDLAYVIYTSGSTGKPKGAMLTHGNAVNTVHAVSSRFGVGEGDRILGFSSLSFDLSVYDLFGSLIAGAALVTLPEQSLREPGDWLRLLEEHQVTVWSSVPTGMKLLLDWCEGRRDGSRTALRWVLLSGDWIPVTLPDRIRAFFPAAEVISLGGPTECCIWQAWRPVGEVDPAWRSIPYGKPMPNHRIYLLDEELRPVPTGEAGEMHIAGDGVGPGYFDDPERTAEVYLHHPVLEERLYKSGDLGRLLPSGELEILGRVDYQVKIRGFRVELGEIESTLLAHEAVSDCAAVAWRDGAGDPQLAAYYTAARLVTSAELRAHIQERLPDYMMPARFIELEALPLNGNQKIDRKDLIRRLEAGGSPAAESAGAGARKPTPAAAAGSPAAQADVLPVAVGPAPGAAAGGGAPSSRPREVRASAGASAMEFYARVGMPKGVTLFDPEERDAFKQRQLALRRDLGDGRGTGGAAPLGGPPLTAERCRAYSWRRSWRRFDPGALPRHRLAAFLGQLRQVHLRGKPKYAWASAGGLYPVQTYLFVREGRVEGLSAGAYYYHPEANSLLPMGGDPEAMGVGLHYPHNREIVEGSAFSLFLVGELEAIRPMYGERARDLCLLEAGLMTQTLEGAAREAEMGFCQIGGMDFDTVRELLELGESQVILHCLLAGPLGPAERALAEEDAERIATPPAAPVAIPVPAAAEAAVGVGAGGGPGAHPVAGPAGGAPSAAPASAPRSGEAPAAPPAAAKAPAAAIEAKLLAMWREIFSLDELDVTDNFFEIGGNSQLAVGAIRRASDELEVEIQVADLFSYPTIRKLAASLAERVPPSALQEAEAAAGSEGPPASPTPGAPVASPVPVHAAPAAASALAPAADLDTRGIAVVGMAGRFPRAESLGEYWDLLRRGEEVITQVPAERWDVDRCFHTDRDRPGTTYSRWGGFLDRLHEFDPLFFRLSPTEARAMDPQQRLLLEVAWETLESAGYAGGRLDGSATGVFVGASYTHHRDQMSDATLDPYMGIGNHNAILANRLSYFLDLNGPCMTVDTLCSSSLVALHLARQSLERGECAQALVGGVQVEMSARYYEALSRLQALSPRGHCYTFDHRADGYVPGEGCGMVLLKPLAQALGDGDRILGVIRGSAVNHGGRAAGLTVPNPLAQAALIRRALEEAGVGAETVGYLEAHGTGTSLGDPIEIDGLTRAFRQDTGRRQFCAIGSVKSNLGHLEPAAGVASLLKVLLALGAGEIPPTLHVEAPNGNIVFEDSPFFVNDRLRPWRRNGSPRRAGISGFGMGGANAHVVVEEAPEVGGGGGGEVDRPVHALMISARGREALAELAGRYAARLESPSEAPLADACFTAATGRARFAERLAVRGSDGGEVAARLRRWGESGRAPGLVSGRVSGRHAPEVVIQFPGQGSQRWGAGRELYATQPTFRRALDRCGEILRPHLGVHLPELLWGEAGEGGRLTATENAQPALFALSWSLYELWRSWGVEASAFIGHSVGEYVAACAAGVWELEEALGLVARRGRLMGALPAGGAMASLRCDEAALSPHVARFGERLSIATVNGPAGTVVSGAASAVEELLRQLDAEGVEGRRLEVSHAFHSALMEPALEELARAVEGLSCRAPQKPLVSNLWGRGFAEGEVPDAAYWCRHAREAVRYSAGVEWLWARGYRVFLEVGPGSVLSGMGRRVVGGEGVWAASLRKGSSEWESLASTLCRLWVEGVEVDGEGWDRDYRRRRTALPTYPFQRVDCRPREAEPAASGEAAGPAAPEAGEPTAQAPAVVARQRWTGEEPLLAQHLVAGRPVLPGAAQLEMVVAALRRRHGVRPYQLQDVSFASMLGVEAGGVREGELEMRGNGEGWHYTLRSRGQGEPEWREHARGRARAWEGNGSETVDVQGLLARGWRERPVDELYRAAEERGLAYGPRFRAVKRLWVGEGEALARLEAAAEAGAGLGDGPTLEPGLLDGGLQALGALLSVGEAGNGHLRVPFSVESLTVHAPLAGSLWAWVRRLEGRGDERQAWGDVQLLSAGGEVLVELRGVCTRRVPAPGGRKGPAAPAASGFLHQFHWQPWEAAASRPLPAGRWLVFKPAGELGDAVLQELEGRGARCLKVEAGESFESLGDGHYRLSPAGAAGYEALVGELLADGEGLAGVLHLWGAAERGERPRDIGELEDRLATGVASLFHLVKALGPRVRRGLELWWATGEGQAVAGDGEGAGVDPERAAGWGLLRTVAQEYGRWACHGLDLEVRGRSAAEGAAAVAEALTLAQAPGQLARWQGRWWVPEVAAAPAASEPPRKLAAGGVYLITGGLGELGLEVARALAEAVEGPRLVLLGRRPLPPRAEWDQRLADHGEGGDAAVTRRLQAVSELEALGAEVWPAAGDAADEARMAELVEEIRRRWGGLSGVVHAAGVLRDGLLASQSEEALWQVLRPKVRGAWVLERVLQGQQLESFILFSSVVGAAGNVGQGAYAAANAYLDALAQELRRRGLPATSLAWGPWSQVGMAARTGVDVRAFGLEPVSPAVGRELFLHALGQPPRNWVLYKRVEDEERQSSGEGRAAAAAPKPGAGAAADDRGRSRRLEEHLRAELAGILGLDPGAVDPEANFMDLGFDSLMALKVHRSLEEAADLRLEPTALFEHPSVRELAEMLVAEHGEAVDRLLAAGGEPEPEPDPPAPDPPWPAPPPSPPPSPSPPPRAVRAAEPARAAEPVRAGDVAVIGMACRFPGAATPEAFWELLRGGVDAVSEVPPERWDWRGVYDPTGERRGTTRSRWGGFVGGVEDFDPAFFGLSPREARLMDPQQRLFLEVVWEALERAGTTPEQLAAGRTGVFVGIAASEYPYLLARDGSHLEPHTGSGNVLSMVPNRTSYLFNWQGPSLAVDTACSSSLVGLHLACRSLAAGEADVAVVGGTNLLLTPTPSIVFSQAGMLAADGRSKTFDDRADGYVRGEGVGAVLLKPLERALADGDDVWAVVRGTAVNHDGHSKAGLTAPNPKAQREVIEAALEAAAVDPATIGLVEAHGTGTSMGDPIEIRGLLQAFGRWTDRRGYCAIGAVKSNVGHLEPAAGIAGLIKAVLALRHGELPPTLHIQRPNHRIYFEETPFYVNDRLRSWPADLGPRRAGVSSFGFGGVNAHAVLEAAPGAPAAEPLEPAEPPVHVLTLSARSATALAQLVRAYRDHLENEPGLELADVCFTAGTGRRHFRHRLAVVARDRAQAVERLAAASSSAVAADGSGSQGPGPMGAGGVFTGTAGEVGLSEGARRRLETVLAELPVSARAALRGVCAGPLWEDEVAPLLPAGEAPESGESGAPAWEAAAWEPPVWERLMIALAALYAAGVEIGWQRVHSGRRRRRVVLPTYPFERRRCWVGQARTEKGDHADEAAPGPGDLYHAAMGALEPASGGRVPAEPQPEEPTPARPKLQEPIAGASTQAPDEAAAGGEGRDLEAYLTERVATALEVEPEEVEATAPLMDLGLDSVATMDLLADVKRDMGITLYASEVIQRPTIRELAAYLGEELTDAGARSLRREPSDQPDGEPAAGPLTEPAVELGSRGAARPRSEVASPAAAFLLSSPRAGSTLLRVMLAGHPDLFCPPELHLLPFAHMGQRQETLGASHLGEGLQRAWMELEGLSAAAGRECVSELVARRAPVAEVYRSLKEGAGGRLLVDKSPSYAADLETLLAAEELFAQPRYLCLVRHPYAVIESFVRNRMDRLLGRTDVDPVDLAEEIWTRSYANLLELTRRAGEERCLWVRYEELVREPRRVAGEVCRFLGAPFHEAVLEPYQGRRMTDGVHRESLSIGDPNFLTHRAIEPSLADAWRGVRLPRPLGEGARQLARELGYSLPAEEPPAAVAVADRPAPAADPGRAPRSRLLSPLVPIQAGGERPPLFCFHPAGGQVFVYQPLAARLGPEQPVFALQSRALADPAAEGESMAALATAYAEAVQRQQPAGPYFLLGWSMGGHLAVCTAYELERRGEEVALVALWDSRFPSLEPARQDDPLRSLALAFGGAIGHAVGALPAAERQALTEGLTALPEAERVSAAVAWARERGVLSPSVPEDELLRQAELVEAHVKLLRHHTPPVIDAPICVWWGRQGLKRRPATDWGRFTRGEVHTSEVEGDHFSMVRGASLGQLARELEERLAQLRRPLPRPAGEGRAAQGVGVSP